jgi:hypothetical protein
VFVLAAAVSLLAGAAQARGVVKPARRAAIHSVCRHVAHPKHGARACPQSHRHVQARGHKRARVRHPAGAQQLPGAPAQPAARTTPGCEDGSAPLRLRDGSLGCSDGSEPACEGGASPVLSPGGSILYCSAPSEAEAAGCEFAPGCASSEPPNPGCEDACVIPPGTEAGG